jgi:hypothetical protein
MNNDFVTRIAPHVDWIKKVTHGIMAVEKPNRKINGAETKHLTNLSMIAALCIMLIIK